MVAAGLGLLQTRANICDTMPKLAKGLMFSKKILNRAAILQFPNERIVSLHMFFVFYSIDVIFLDAQKKVVEIKKNFKPFTFYSSMKKAKYAIEVVKGLIVVNSIRIGDKLDF